MKNSSVIWLVLWCALFGWVFSAELKPKDSRWHCRGTIRQGMFGQPEPFDVTESEGEFKDDTARAERAGMIVSYRCND